jgi:hypothetical protein
MRSQIDDIISIMNQVIGKSMESELSEQDAPAAGGGDTGGDVKPEYPTVTKWESGVARGPANQIAVVKWADIVKLNRGKANTLL